MSKAFSHLLGESLECISYVWDIPFESSILESPSFIFFPYWSTISSPSKTWVPIVLSSASSPSLWGQGTPWSWLWHPGDVLMSHNHQGPVFLQLVYSSNVLYKGRSKRIWMTSPTELTIYCYHYNYMSDCDFGYCSNGYTKCFLVYLRKLLPCIWISEFNRIQITTRNIPPDQWLHLSSPCKRMDVFLWFPFTLFDITSPFPVYTPLACSHRRKSETPHKRDIHSSPQWIRKKNWGKCIHFKIPSNNPNPNRSSTKQNISLDGIMCTCFLTHTQVTNSGSI